jgi:Ion channel
VEQTGPKSANKQQPAGRSLLVELIRAPDSYGLLLLVLVVDYVLLSSGWSGRSAFIVTTAFLGITPLLAFHTSRVHGRMFRAVVVAVGVAGVAGIVAAVAGEDQAKGVAFAIGSILILACPFAIGRRILHHNRVTIETLLGAICIYVLIGLDFSYIDLSYQLISGRSYFAQGHQGPSSFSYFSFITMTTVGYGDLSPSPGLPRTTAVLEALVGQIFLVVLVARLVAMYQPIRGMSPRSLTRARIEGETSAGATLGHSGESTPSSESQSDQPREDEP